MGPHLRSIGFLLWFFVLVFWSSKYVCELFQRRFSFPQVLQFLGILLITFFSNVFRASCMDGMNEAWISCSSGKDPSVTLPTRDHMAGVCWWDYISRLLCLLSFFFLLWELCSSSFRFISKEIIPGVVVDMLCLWEIVSFRDFLCFHLDPLHSGYLFFQKQMCVASQEIW